MFFWMPGTDFFNMTCRLNEMKGITTAARAKDARLYSKSRTCEKFRMSGTDGSAALIGGTYAIIS